MLAVAATILLALTLQRPSARVVWHDSPDATQPFFRDVPGRAASADPFLVEEHPRPAGPVRRVVWSSPSGWPGVPDTPRIVFEYDREGRTTLIETRDEVFERIRQRTTYLYAERTTTIERSDFPRSRPESGDPVPSSSTKRVWSFDGAGRPLGLERLLDGGRTLVELRFAYDEEGRVRSRTAFDQGGYVADVLMAHYDPRGRLDEILYGVEDEAPRKLYRLEHDLDDRVTAVLDADGRPLLRNEYRADGRIATCWRAGEQAGGSSVGESLTELDYDEHGVPVEIESLRFAAGGGYQGRSIRTFVASDRLLHSIYVDVTGFVRSEASYDYGLDARGNWIARIATPNRPRLPDARLREARPETVRTIEYYE